MPLSIKQRTDLVKCYYQADNSIRGALRRYRWQNKLRTGPCSEKTLRNLIDKFEDTGSVRDKKSTGRPAVSDIEVAEVLNESNEMSKENVYGMNSARGVARRLNKPITTTWKIMRKTLKLYPYRFKRVHQLLPHDLATRMDFSLKCVAEIENDEHWLHKILWSDEAHFDLNGGVNTRYFPNLHCQNHFSLLENNDSS